MYVMAREGSAWKDLRPIVRGLIKAGVDLRRLILVSDDRHPGDLLARGHVDHLLRLAISEGVDPVKAVQCVTLNVAEHYRLDSELGAIAPGRHADMVVLDSLERVEVRDVYIAGSLVASKGNLLVSLRPPKYPKWAVKTMNVAKIPSLEDLVISSKNGGIANVIGIIEHSAITRHLEVRVNPGIIAPDPSKDLLIVTVIERHRATGNFSVGIVTGFGLSKGAVASSIAHDSHNIIAVGATPEDIHIAIKNVIEMGGGISVVKGGKSIASIALPLAGLMTSDTAERAAKKLEHVEEGWRRLGCTIENPFMTMSLLALPVIPELRITDKGLVDVVNMKIIPVITR